MAVNFTGSAVRVCLLVKMDWVFPPLLMKLILKPAFLAPPLLPAQMTAETAPDTVVSPAMVIFQVPTWTPNILAPAGDFPGQFLTSAEELPMGLVADITVPLK